MKLKGLESSHGLFIFQFVKEYNSDSFSNKHWIVSEYTETENLVI